MYGSLSGMIVSFLYHCSTYGVVFSVTNYYIHENSFLNLQKVTLKKWNKRRKKLIFQLFTFLCYTLSSSQSVNRDRSIQRSVKLRTQKYLVVIFNNSVKYVYWKVLFAPSILGLFWWAIFCQILQQNVKLKCSNTLLPNKYVVLKMIKLRGPCIALYIVFVRAKFSWFLFYLSIALLFVYCTFTDFSLGNRKLYLISPLQ